MLTLLQTSIDVSKNDNVYPFLQLNRSKDRLKQKKIDIHFTDEAVNLLAQLGFDPNYGARPVKRVIQQMVENEIALGVLKGDIKEDDSVILGVDASPSSKELPPTKKLVIKKLQDAPCAEELVANR